MSTPHEELHRLVDAIPVSQISLAKRLLEAVLEQAAQDDPFLRALANAPIDDEPETPGEAEAVAEARAQVSRGETISDVDLWRELGHDDEKS